MQQHPPSNSILKCQENVSTKKKQGSEITISSDDVVHIQVRQQIRTNKLTKFGPWNSQQIRKYCNFLKAQKKDTSWLNHQQNQIFFAMSQSIRTRNVHQCKIHHTKLLRKFKTYSFILKYYRQNKKTSFQENISQSKIQIQAESKKKDSLSISDDLPNSLFCQGQNDICQKYDFKKQKQVSCQKGQQILCPTNDVSYHKPVKQMKKHSNSFLKLLNNEYCQRESFGTSNPYLQQMQSNPFIKVIEQPGSFESYSTFYDNSKKIFLQRKKNNKY